MDLKFFFANFDLLENPNSKMFEIFENLPKYVHMNFKIWFLTSNLKKRPKLHWKWRNPSISLEVKFVKVCEKWKVLVLWSDIKTSNIFYDMQPWIFGIMTLTTHPKLFVWICLVKKHLSIEPNAPLSSKIYWYWTIYCPVCLLKCQNYIRGCCCCCHCLSIYDWYK